MKGIFVNSIKKGSRGTLLFWYRLDPESFIESQYVHSLSLSLSDVTVTHLKGRQLEVTACDEMKKRAGD